MKTLSILGVIGSVAGIALTVTNWLFFTLQLPGTYSEEIYKNGEHHIQFTGNLTHHEHSMTIGIIMILLYLFFLAFSIKGLTIKK
jgi:hypothetical protein